MILKKFWYTNEELEKLYSDGKRYRLVYNKLYTLWHSQNAWYCLKENIFARDFRNWNISYTKRWTHHICNYKTIKKFDFVANIELLIEAW